MVGPAGRAQPCATLNAQRPGESEKGETLTLPPRILSQRPQLSDFSNELTSQKPSASAPRFEAAEFNRREKRSNSELFAAALGNLQWLRFCLNSNRGEIVTDSKVLIEEYRFPVDLRSISGQTPLHLVIHRDNTFEALPCIHYLLRKGAALNCQTSNGSTPLHLAAREGLMGIVKVLVKNGADVHTRDARGYKAIDYCKLWNDRPCARFLMDAMWRQDKKDISSEKVKLKQLKDRLTIMELNFLTEYQNSYQIRVNQDYQKWLHRKLPEPALASKDPAGVPLIPSLAEMLPSMSARCTQEARRLLAQQEHPQKARQGNLTQPQKARRGNLTQPQKARRGNLTQSQKARRGNLTQSQKARWGNLTQSQASQCNLTEPQDKRQRAWNFSTNPARPPVTQIGCPQGIRLGLHPDPDPEHDLSCFLDVNIHRPGQAQLLTKTGQKVVPLPRLPFEVILGTLCPSQRPCRMKVPEGLRPSSLSHVPGKRHWPDAFWTDTLAMSLRKTFEDAFVSAVRAHQGPSTMPSPLGPP